MYSMNTEHLILHGKIFAVCSAVRTKHINTLREKTIEFVTAILTDIFFILSLSLLVLKICYSTLFIYLFLLAIRKNTIYELYDDYTQYATMPCITMTW